MSPSDQARSAPISHEVTALDAWVDKRQALTVGG
jgi:hypothetical protein